MRGKKNHTVREKAGVRPFPTSFHQPLQFIMQVTVLTFPTKLLKLKSAVLKKLQTILVFENSKI